MPLILGRMPMALLLLLMANPALAGLEPTQICAAAARKAAADHDVPFEVMMAVARVESGRSSGAGGAVPWPWTLNVGGKGGYFDSRSDAETMIGELLVAGKDNFDIGCFQLNYHWHGAAFASAQAMLEPEPNADYAAALLRSKFDESGDWVLAAGAYHSGTKEFADRYMAKIQLALGDPTINPGQTFEVADATSITEPLRNWFLADGATSTTAMGSLVALSCSTCTSLP